MYYGYSSAFHPEVFLGDEQVVNTSTSSCDECIGLRPYYSPRKASNTTLNRVRREDDLLEKPLPPFDGPLDINSNYTGFVEIIGKIFISVLLKNSAELVC